jgi:hypothetical protein
MSTPYHVLIERLEAYYERKARHLQKWREAIDLLKRQHGPLLYSIAKGTPLVPPSTHNNSVDIYVGENTRKDAMLVTNVRQQLSSFLQEHNVAVNWPPPRHGDTALLVVSVPSTRLQEVGDVGYIRTLHSVYGERNVGLVLIYRSDVEKNLLFAPVTASPQFVLSSSFGDNTLNMSFPGTRNALDKLLLFVKH